jgi:hypothetical protein
VVVCSPSMHNTLDSIPNTAKNKTKKKTQKISKIIYNHFFTAFLKSGVYFTLTTHLSSDELHFKCAIPTWLMGPVRNGAGQLKYSFLPSSGRGGPITRSSINTTNLHLYLNEHTERCVGTHS